MAQKYKIKINYGFHSHRQLSIRADVFPSFPMALYWSLCPSLIGFVSSVTVEIFISNISKVTENPFGRSTLKKKLHIYIYIFKLGERIGVTTMSMWQGNPLSLNQLVHSPCLHPWSLWVLHSDSQIFTLWLIHLFYGELCNIGAFPPWVTTKQQKVYQLFLWNTKCHWHIQMGEAKHFSLTVSFLSCFHIHCIRLKKSYVWKCYFEMH